MIQTSPSSAGIAALKQYGPKQREQNREASDDVCAVREVGQELAQI